MPRYIEFLQEKNGWSDNTIQVIAWKSLFLGIKRINWTVLVTKICNRLLPKAVNLKNWNWKSHDSCTLYKQKETMEHLIQCPDPSQNAWQIQYISKLRQKFSATNTADALTMYLFTMITN